MPRKVVIVGGSIAGLMCGIALKHAGHHVTILERDDDERQSHMAGVCLGQDAKDWLAGHDRHTAPFTRGSNRVQQLTADGQVQVLVHVRRDITNWDTLYFRLRSLFDGYPSPWYPTPPAPVETDGPAVYARHSEVVSIDDRGPDPRESGKEDSQVMVGVRDRNTGETWTVHADLVVAADGPNSFIRAKYLPDVRRDYAGYIAWRGTVPESEVSDETRALFRRSVTVHRMGGHHCLVYSIPGRHGSLRPGERALNFLWYTNETPGALDEIMRDGQTGHRHHYIVPAGRVRADLWAAQLRRARSAPFPAPFLEVVTRIREPFIQVITDFCSPRAALAGGRVLLVGDALSLYRPHTAFSATQAAFDALMVEAYAGGRVSPAGWEDRVLRYAALHWSQSTMWGEFYQRGASAAAVAAMRHHALGGLERLRAWWRGEAPLLRSPMPPSEDRDDEED